MRTVYLLLVAVVIVPRMAHAQRTAAIAGPVTRADLRIVPAPGTSERHAVPAPEFLPLGPMPDQTPQGVTLADMEAMALANNPTLARSAARVEAARGQWVQAGLPPNPTAGYTSSEIGQDGQAGQQGGFVGQEFVTGGKLGLSRAVAAQEIRVAEQQMAAQRLRVVNDVRIGFYDVLAAQRRLEIAQELAAIGQRSAETVEKFFQAKETSRVDLLQAQVESGSAKILLENAGNDHLAAWRKLAAVVGMPSMAAAPIVGDLQSGVPEIDFEAALQQLLACSPELAEARANVGRAQQVVARASAEPVPNLDVQASAQHDNATGYDIAGVQVGLPIPLFNRNQGAVRRALGELAAARYDVQRVELDLRQRLASAYQRYANARQQVTTYTQEIMPAAQTSLDLVTNGYRQGEFGYLTLLTSQRTYFQTNLAYVESLRHLRESAILIEGLLVAESLKASESAR